MARDGQTVVCTWFPQDPGQNGICTGSVRIVLSHLSRVTSWPAGDRRPRPYERRHPLQLAAVHIANSLQRALDSLIGFIPNLIGFLVILAIGYLIARVVKTVVAKLLEKVGVDRALHGSQAGQYVERVSPGAHPSRLIGAIAFWFIFIYAIAAAIGALKIPALTNFMANVQNYLPNVVAAVLIFVIGAAAAGAVGGLADRLMGDTSTGRVARAVGPGLILAIVFFMVLTQLKIAPTIVTATYIALIGMLAL